MKGLADYLNGEDGTTNEKYGVPYMMGPPQKKVSKKKSKKPMNKGK